MQTSAYERLHMNTSMILICIWLVCRLGTALHTKCCNSFCVSIHFAVVDYCRFVGIKNVNDRTIMKGYRRVAIVEEFYHILKQIHDKDCLHAGS